MIDFLSFLKRLCSYQVEFVVIGGVAAVLQGSSYTTFDIDICYNRLPENLQKLVNCLLPLYPKLRDAPSDLPFVFDVLTIKAGLNFTLETTMGNIDILGEVGGIGSYDAVKILSHKLSIEGEPIFVLNIDALIKSKKFAGRKKDEPVIIELEAIKEIQASKK